MKWLGYFFLSILCGVILGGLAGLAISTLLRILRVFGMIEYRTNDYILMSIGAIIVTVACFIILCYDNYSNLSKKLVLVIGFMFFGGIAGGVVGILLFFILEIMREWFHIFTSFNIGFSTMIIVTVIIGAILGAVTARTIST